MNNNTNDDLKPGPKMDALVAEKVMLWDMLEPGSGCGKPECGCRGFIQNNWLIRGKLCRGERENDYKPSARISQAFEMETELERRGLKDGYIHELFRNVVLGYEVEARPSSIFWLLAHASPEQRCRAALACVAEIK